MMKKQQRHIIKRHAHSMKNKSDGINNKKRRRQRKLFADEMNKFLKKKKKRQQRVLLAYPVFVRLCVHITGDVSLDEGSAALTGRMNQDGCNTFSAGCLQCLITTQEQLEKHILGA